MFLYCGVTIEKWESAQRDLKRNSTTGRNTKIWIESWRPVPARRNTLAIICTVKSEQTEVFSQSFWVHHFWLFKWRFKRSGRKQNSKIYCVKFQIDRNWRCLVILVQILTRLIKLMRYYKDIKLFDVSRENTKINPNCGQHHMTLTRKCEFFYVKMLKYWIQNVIFSKAKSKFWHITPNLSW